MSDHLTALASQQAEGAVEAGQNYKPSEAEETYNRFSDVVFGRVLPVLQSDAAQDAAAFAMSEAEHFKQRCHALRTLLGGIAAIHPFIGVAVKAFDACIVLELTRRENDAKALTLLGTMTCMMETLGMLKGVEAGEIAEPAQRKLEARMSKVHSSIIKCGKVCDSYHKRNLLVKVIMCLKWQEKFTQVASEFAEHQEALRDLLQIHTALSIVDLKKLILDLPKQINQSFFQMTFEKHLSATERQLHMVSKGRANDDPALLQDLIKKSADVKAAARGPAVDEDMPPMEQLEKEVKGGVDRLIDDNTIFETKFSVVLDNLNSMMQLINIAQENSKEIVDNDMKVVWRRHDWRGHVEARHLAVALYHHFHHRERPPTGPTDANASVDVDAGNDDEADDSETRTNLTADPGVPPISDADSWTLQYITVHQQSLVEALDDDLSAYITTAEINRFTALCPLDWRLPHWIAYWTVGFELTVRWYYRRIRRLYLDLAEAASNALPWNREAINTFITNPEIRWIEDLLSGFHNAEHHNLDWDSDRNLSMFKNYVVASETLLGEKLRAMNYRIEEEHALTLVSGGARTETFLLPMAFLLLRRSLTVIQTSESSILSQKELSIVQGALSSLRDVVHHRIRSLQNTFKYRALNAKEQLGHYFFGLYSHVLAKPEIGPYWLCPLGADAASPSDVQYTEDLRPHPVVGNEAPKLDVILKGNLPALQPHSQSNGSLPRLIGHWKGHFSLGDGNGGKQLDSTFTIFQASSSSFTGSGTDALGAFIVCGDHQERRRYTFTKQYLVTLAKDDEPWQWKGSIEIKASGNRLTGSWSANFMPGERPQNESAVATLGDRDTRNDHASSTPVQTCSGTLTFERRDPTSYPDDITARGEQRSRFFLLFLEDRWRFGSVTARDWAELIKDVHPRDLHQWKHIADDGNICAVRENASPIEGGNIVHSEDAKCGICNVRIMNARMICTVCSDKKAYSDWFSLCYDCFAEGKEKIGDGKVHAANHSVVQWRLVRAPSYVHPYMSEAKKVRICADGAVARVGTGQVVADNIFALSSDPFRCIECKWPVMSRPYWCCIDCERSTLVGRELGAPVSAATDTLAPLLCYACNERIQREQPWLYQRRANARYAQRVHHWSHTLVSVPVGWDESEAAYSADERLARLENEVKTLRLNMDNRLTNMEGHLSGGSRSPLAPIQSPPPTDAGSQTASSTLRSGAATPEKSPADPLPPRPTPFVPQVSGSTPLPPSAASAPPPVGTSVIKAEISEKPSGPPAEKGASSSVDNSTSLSPGEPTAHVRRPTKSMRAWLPCCTVM